MHPQMLNELVVLHELAHCLAPRHAQSRAKWRLPYAHVAQLPAHGPGFAAAMSELVDEFASGADRDELRSAYRHYEVGVLDPASYRQAISESLRSEDAVIAFDALRAEERGMEDLGRWTSCLEVGARRCDR